MIAYLEGIVVYKSQNSIIASCNGIGYEVFCHTDLLDKSKINEQVKCFTYHKISEDNQALYGFGDMLTKNWFELLLSVNGVGPKAALAILNYANISSVEAAIMSDNSSFFANVPGIGKKTAQRIIIELKSKISNMDADISNLGSENSDLYNALKHLGYNPREIQEAIQIADPASDFNLQLKQALKFLGK